MGHACRVAIFVAILAVIVTIEEVQSEIKRVDFIIDRSTNRRVGYRVTKVRRIDTIDRKDDLNETVTVPANTTKIDRDSGGEEEREHAGEFLVEQIPDTQAVETSYAGELSSASLSEEHHFDHAGEEDQKVITIYKNVPDPYPVEKTVHIPIFKKVPYVVEVPEPEPFPIEKQIHYPVRVVVKVPVRIPKPIAVIHESYYPVHVPVDRPVPHRVYIPDPYPVEKKVYYEVKVPVPEPFPVERKIPIPIKIPIHVPQPVPVDKIVPYPVKVEQERPVPVPILKPFPVPIPKHIPFPVEKYVPYPVKVKVENPVPVPYDKPVPVRVEVKEEVPYPVEKEVPYPVEKEVPYPVPVHEKKDEKPIIEHRNEHPSSTEAPKEPPKVHEEKNE